MDTINLMGAEDVRNAGHTMQQAASEMRQAALTISEAMETQRRFLEEWLARLEAIKEPA